MKVLIVDEEIPWPLDTGKRLRTYNLLQRLQRSHAVTYLCYGAAGALLPGCPNVKLVIVPSPVVEQKGLRFYCALFANLFSDKPYIVARHHSRCLAEKVRGVVADEKFDLIHCEWTPYTENIRQVIKHLPSVLSAHNVEARIWERYFTTEKNLFKRWYIFLQWKKLLRYEAEAVRNYTIVSTVSDPDSEAMRKEYRCARVTTVPNGVDEAYFSPAKGAVTTGNMVFTGSMDWRPNQDGVRYFIEEIFPLIREQVPAATFTVVGRKPPQWLLDLGRRVEGVVVTGTVEDVRPYVARSALYVVPLRVGGGSRLKILEALSMGKIVLSTTVGAEGLAVEDGRHVLMRDSPHDFASAACAVLQCRDRYAHLGEAGRELVTESYTWDAITRVMDDVWREAVA